MTNGNGRVVNYTQSGLVPHSQLIVRVTADSMATDTVPEELAHLRSLNITVMTFPDGEGTWPHHTVVYMHVATPTSVCKIPIGNMHHIQCYSDIDIEWGT